MLLRFMACCLGAWMFALPQLMVSQIIAKSFNEQGCNVPPLAEEEELEKNEGIAHGPGPLEHGSSLLNVQGMGPSETEVPRSVPHEVQVPPPWH